MTDTHEITIGNYNDLKKSNQRQRNEEGSCPVGSAHFCQVFRKAHGALETPSQKPQTIHYGTLTSHN